MKRFILFIKLIFILPFMFFSRQHAQKLNFEERIKITKIWVNDILKKANVKVLVTNTHLIPLEDGYTFVSNHESKYDGLLVLSANPLNFSFFIDTNERLPYMTPFLDLIDSIRYNIDTRDDYLIKMSQDLHKHKNFHLYIENLNQELLSSALLDASYISKTAIVPVAIKNSKSFMKFGHQKIEVSYCTPLHFEEFGNLSADTTLKEIKTRILRELKQGDKNEISRNH